MSKFTRFLLLILIVTFSVFVGKFAFDSEFEVISFKYSSYWFIFILFGLFVLSLYRGYCGWVCHCVQNKVWKQIPILDLAFIALATVLTIRAEPVQFKILMDEHVIAATSKVMSEARLVYVPTRAYHMLNSYEYLNGFVDKRPIFFHFMVSLLHDFTGYRVNNPIYLNMILLPVFLGLIYGLGRRVGGRTCGLLFLTLFITVPIFPQTAVSGSMEMLNLVMISLTLILALNYMHEPNTWKLASLCFSSLLLAHTRYESVIYLFIPIVAIIYCWIKKREVAIKWPLFLCPIFLIPTLWQQSLFSLNRRFWELDNIGVEGGPFGFAYFYDNLAEMLMYYFSFEKLAPNSVLVSLVGLSGCVWGVLYFINKILNRKKWNDVDVLYFITCLVFLLALTIQLFYAWPFSNLVVLRLSLPFQLGLSFWGAFAVVRIVKNRKQRIAVLVLAWMFVAGVSLSKTNYRDHARKNPAEVDYVLIDQFIKNELKRSDTVIAENASYYIINEVNTLTVKIANSRKQAVKDYLSSRLAGTLYLVERLKYDFDSNSYLLVNNNDLDDDFKTKILYEYHQNPLYSLRISQVVDVIGYTPSEIEINSRKDYLESWAKSLP